MVTMVVYVAGPGDTKNKSVRHGPDKISSTKTAPCRTHSPQQKVGLYSNSTTTIRTNNRKETRPSAAADAVSVAVSVADAVSFSRRNSCDILGPWNKTIGRMVDNDRGTNPDRAYPSRLIRCCYRAVPTVASPFVVWRCWRFAARFIGRGLAYVPEVHVRG